MAHMIFECPRCGSRNLKWEGKITSCQECGWSNEGRLSKFKKWVSRSRQT